MGRRKGNQRSVHTQANGKQTEITQREMTAPALTPVSLTQTEGPTVTRTSAQQQKDITRESQVHPDVGANEAVVRKERLLC